VSLGTDTHIVAGGTLEDLPRVEPPAPHCTDLGNSERFVRQHGVDVRYCYLWKTYLECPVPYEPTARCPRFEEFLLTIFAKDKVLIA
jgi:hypothetical protein